MTPAPGFQVHQLRHLDEDSIRELSAVLADCVEGGASVSFMLPLGPERAAGFWRMVAEGVEHGQRALLVARDQEGIVGTVQLIMEQPENQPHRADLAKLLVHRRGRRVGIGASLMRAAEALARQAGKSLLVLDTADAGAERLYSSLGWIRCGTVPGYALLPQGGLCATTFFYRELGAARSYAPAAR